MTDPIDNFEDLEKDSALRSRQKSIMNETQNFSKTRTLQ